MLAFAEALSTAAEGGGSAFNPLQIQFGAAFWTWVIFLVSLPLMWKNVFQPITKALHDRDAKAEAAIARAEEAQAATEKARLETEKQLQDAREQAQRQVREARERAESQAQELLAQAQRDAEASRQKALSEIDAERRRAIAEIRDLTVDVSLDAASRLIKRDLKGEDQRTFVDDFVQKADAFRS